MKGWGDGSTAGRIRLDRGSGGVAMKWMIGLSLLALSVAAGAPGRAEEPAELKVGDKAPNFKLMGTDGKEYSLDQFKGKSAVVIAWYPRALTGG
jgi:thioredoxin-dependent peroxiredoxin